MMLIFFLLYKMSAAEHFISCSWLVRKNRMNQHLPEEDTVIYQTAAYSVTCFCCFIIFVGGRNKQYAPAPVENDAPVIYQAATVQIILTQQHIQFFLFFLFHIVWLTGIIETACARKRG
jgi:hypothetical protein